MLQTLRYKDDKSDKFWRLETYGCALAVNWGRIGATGRYEIKEFDTEELCEKNAAKLAAAKRKKGYVEMPEFDAFNHCYFDTEEYGLHPLTSHPIFRKFFADKLYYNCIDEETPFGNDNGNDALFGLQDMLRKRSKFNVADFPKLLIEKNWKMPYLPPISEQTDNELKTQAALNKNTLPNGDQLLLTDQVIIAVALGQIKITGKSDAALQQLVLLSLMRMEKLYRLFWNWKEKEAPHHITIIRRDLTAFLNQKQANC